MASGDTLFYLTSLHNLAPAWAFVAFTSGSVQPSLSDVIWGDTSDQNGELEMLVLTSGTWGGGDAAGYMLLSFLTGDVGDWTSGENFTANSTTPGNHGTLTGIPAHAFATIDTSKGKSLLNFDATVNELAIFQVFMPRHYGGGGVTLTLGLAGAAVTGDMDFEAAFMSVSDDVDNILSATLGKQFAATNKNEAIDAPTVVGEITVDEIAFTDGADMDSVAAGEMFYLLIMRDAQDTTNDDMAGDGHLLFVEGRET